MGKTNVAIDNDLEKRFRNAVFASKGMRKGNISEALEETIDVWILEEARKRGDIK